jgi:hypothetical protein
MPATTFTEYVQRLTELLNHVVATGETILNTSGVTLRQK